MPSAVIMLMCYEDQLQRARAQGLPAMRERARLALRIQALTELVAGDFDRGWDEPLERLRPAA